MVVNFVDVLAHKSSQMDVLREMVPNESGYRIAVKAWFENLVISGTQVFKRNGMEYCTDK